jgi:hypothetical protein
MRKMCIHSMSITGAVPVPVTDLATSVGCVDGAAGERLVLAGLGGAERSWSSPPEHDRTDVNIPLVISLPSAFILSSSSFPRLVPSTPGAQVLKSRFSSMMGSRHTVVDVLCRATDVMLAGKRAVVCGYGDVRGSRLSPPQEVTISSCLTPRFASDTLFLVKAISVPLAYRAFLTIGVLVPVVLARWVRVVRRACEPRGPS